MHRFTLDQSVGEFIHFENMKMPEGGGKKIYSCNEGNSVHWDKPFVQVPYASPPVTGCCQWIELVD